MYRVGTLVTGRFILWMAAEHFCDGDKRDTWYILCVAGKSVLRPAVDGHARPCVDILTLNIALFCVT